MARPLLRSCSILAAELKLSSPRSSRSGEEVPSKAGWTQAGATADTPVVARIEEATESSQRSNF